MADLKILNEDPSYKEKLSNVKVGDLVVVYSPFPNMRYLSRVTKVTPKFIETKEPVGFHKVFPNKFVKDTGVVFGKGWDIYLDFVAEEDIAREILSQMKLYTQKQDLRKLSLPKGRVENLQEAFKLLTGKTFNLPV